MSATSRSESVWNGGISTPGLIAGASSIHRSRFAVLFSIGARAERACVRRSRLRFGPIVPARPCRSPCGIRRTLRAGTRPGRCAIDSEAGSPGGRSWRASHRPKSPGDWTCTTYRHVRVLDAAVLGALADVRAGVVGGEAQFVELARNRIDLPRELRDPEAVDDVVGGEPDLDRPADREVDLVGGLDPRVRGSSPATTSARP